MSKVTVTLTEDQVATLIEDEYNHIHSIKDKQFYKSNIAFRKRIISTLAKTLR